MCVFFTHVTIYVRDLEHVNCSQNPLKLKFAWKLAGPGCLKTTCNLEIRGTKEPWNLATLFLLREMPGCVGRGVVLSRRLGYNACGILFDPQLTDSWRVVCRVVTTCNITARKHVYNR